MESKNWNTGLKSGVSTAVALSNPIRTAKIKLTKRKEPSAKAEKAELGKSERISVCTSSLKTSVAVSTVIGMRGSFTSRIESNPTEVKIKVEQTITRTVHRVVLKNNFEERSLFTEIIAVEKTSGTTMYRPILIINSVKKEIKATKDALFMGKTRAAIIPNKIPSKYFIQSFITQIIPYISLESHSIVRYN